MLFFLKCSTTSVSNLNKIQNLVQRHYMKIQWHITTFKKKYVKKIMNYNSLNYSRWKFIIKILLKGIVFLGMNVDIGPSIVTGVANCFV